MKSKFLSLLLLLSLSAAAQDGDSVMRSLRPQATARSADHFLLQLGYLSWSGAPDSLNTTGLPRTFNMYLLLDFPFKTNPKFSVALGPGIATDNMYFEDTEIGIKDRTPTLQFRDRSDTTSFNKYKLATAYLEAPIELRFQAKPDDSRRSFKAALGVKVGTLLSAKIRGVELQDSRDNTVNDYVLKEKSKNFFNKQRLSLTGRVGYGHWSLFASYAATPLFKEGTAPTIRPFSFGLTLSGL